jgi:hypothetical protein
MEEKGKVFSIKGEPIKQGKSSIYHMRLCLVGSDDLDLKNIQTFGIAEDGFFMVKSFNNPKLPIFMTNPMRIKSVEIYKKGDKPLTKLKKEKGDDDFLVDLLRKNNVTQSKIK